MNPQEQNPNVKPSNGFLTAVGTARPDQLDVTSTRSGDVQMNVVNAVNANGIVSGRKVVSLDDSDVARLLALALSQIARRGPRSVPYESPTGRRG